MSTKRATREYKEQNVYDAAMERYKFIFDNFPRIYLSFSGGKDSVSELSSALSSMERFK